MGSAALQKRRARSSQAWMLAPPVVLGTVTSTHPAVLAPAPGHDAVTATAIRAAARIPRASRRTRRSRLVAERSDVC
jgi:hypothetical protein